MAEPLTPDAFYDSGRDFARTALEAHHVQDYRRMAVDAGTALEHLVKACLATRSPALLVELKGEASFQSLLWLLGMPSQQLRQLRTVGLRDALQRVKSFVVSPASDADLRTLVDLRDGTVHAAMNEKLEECLMAAFAQHADALLSDLGRDRSVFWGSQLNVVDALLADASDEVKHRVQVLLAGARAQFEQRYGSEPPELIELVQQLEPDREPEPPTLQVPCPVCQTPGAVLGTDEIEPGVIRIDVDGFSCRICGLRAEIEG